MGNCLKSTRTHSSFFLITSSNSQQNQEIDVPPRHPPPPYQVDDPILHPTPGVSRPVSQLTEEEQVKIAIRLGLISTLPYFKFEEKKREKLIECIICMCEYEVGEELRYLPCLHTYHKVCIDDWLTRSFVCPSCLDEVDIALMRSPNATSPYSRESNESNCDETQVDQCEVGDHQQGNQEPVQADTDECNAQQETSSCVLETNNNMNNEATNVETGEAKLESPAESLNGDGSETRERPGANSSEES